MVVKDHVGRGARHQFADMRLAKYRSVSEKDVLIGSVRSDDIQVIQINLIAGHQYRADRWVGLRHDAVDTGKGAVPKPR
ncbi:hypothetical protein D3C76_1434470 [compost metagenome]